MPLRVRSEPKTIGFGWSVGDFSAGVDVPEIFEVLVAFEEILDGLNGRSAEDGNSEG